MASNTRTGPERLRAVFIGTDDPRLRATWQFVLAWPLLFIVCLIPPRVILSDR